MERTLGNKIREIRGGLTQQEFADLIGITKSAVSMYENNRRIPRDELKKKISEIANRSIQDIFFE